MQGFRVPARLVAAAACTATILAQGQATPPPPPAPDAQPTFRTEANYVRVDAYPTRNGAPVTDLTRDDFEILEGGQPQRIDQFERVQVGAAASQEARAEPNTVAESRSMAASPRARLFVVFLDTYHVDVAGSHTIRKPLVDALDRLIGPDDMVAVMTPEMAASDVTFARRTTTIEGMLARYWDWGERDRLNQRDALDEQYRSCYPRYEPPHPCADQNEVAAEMIARRHEMLTLSALHDLVVHLRGIREERKAILAISDGWLLFRPNPRLVRPLACRTSPPDNPAGVDPRNGRLTTKDAGARGIDAKCEVDRTTDAQLDNDQTFRELLDEANRANASFYPIDPRGLPVFDTPISDPAAPRADAAMLRNRATSLRTLAEATDGLALLNSNDLAGSFRRIVNDLSSYYLLGYYSAGKLDGRFHAITVKVKRPGVQVRARRGYLAATPAEAAKLERAANPNPTPTPAEAEALAIESVLRPLGAFARETSLRLRAAAAWKTADRPTVWLVGELGTADSWKAGAEADVTLTRDGDTKATAHVTVPAGARTFRVALAPPAPLEPGDYSINVRTTAASRLASSNDMVPLPLPPAPENLGSLIVRRGPFTGLKEVPTADLRFRRSEQMRVEVPIAASGPAPAATARLLDRNGKTMAGVPMTAAVRDDADGTRWATAQVPLFPLAPGDYIVEIAAGSVRTLTPFRMVQ
jgi:VWFA-related protein